jgi:L-lactate utilization protein LutB
MIKLKKLIIKNHLIALETLLLPYLVQIECMQTPSHCIYILLNKVHKLRKI